jgi:hypothetical protein
VQLAGLEAESSTATPLAFVGRGGIPKSYESLDNLSYWTSVAALT